MWAENRQGSDMYFAINTMKDRAIYG